MKKKVTLLLGLLLTISLMSQNYPVKNIDGIDYFVYTVEQGEGLYRISKKFNVLQSDIYRVNPELVDGLKKGQTIYIPVEASDSRQESTLVYNKLIEHKVVAKQTLYSISKMYGVEQSAIIHYNPEIENSTIKIGQILKIPVSNFSQSKNQNKIINKINNVLNKKSSKDTVVNVQKNAVATPKKFVTYEIKEKGETLYSISRKFGVSLNDIIDANPYVKDGIRRGDILQIPIVEKNVPKKVDDYSQNIMHIVQPKETIYRITKQYNVSQEQLMKDNPLLKDGLKAGDTIIIYIPDNLFNINQEIGVKDQFNIVYLLPFSVGENKSSKSTDIGRFVEFYRGSLIALDVLKSGGQSFNIYTYDTQLDTEKLNAIIKSNGDVLRKADLIIGPAYADQVSLVAQFARNNNIPQVVPFSSKVEKKDKFDIQYQFNPSNDDFSEKISSSIASEFKRAKVSFIDFNENNAQTSVIKSKLQMKLRKESVRFANISFRNINESHINSLSRSRDNLVVLYGCTLEEFNSLLSYFHPRDLKKITFLVDEPIFYGAINNDALEELNLVTYSLFNPAPEENYLDSYATYFQVRVNQSIPNYDLLGYDLTLYFASSNRVDNRLEFKNNNTFQQSNFNFNKQDIGFVNLGCFKYVLLKNKVQIEKI